MWRRNKHPIVSKVDMSRQLSRPKSTSKPQKSYLIHDNGGRPFSVNISDGDVSVYTYNQEDGDTDYSKKDYTEHIVTFKSPLKIWIGEQYDKNPYFKGNTILLQMGNNKYVFIGSSIYSFSLQKEDEKIKIYKSDVGNSNVPYPYIVTDRNIYFMADNCFVSLEFYSKEDYTHNDPYMKHYDFHKTLPKNYKKHPLKNKKVIQKRLW
jgi:hypothetical protein